MKKWPENDKPASFEDVASPFIKAVRFAYNLERKNEGKSIPYNGYDNGDLACCPGIKTLFNKDSLAYNLDDQGRDALTVIIQAAIQVGIEQGRRIALNSDEVETLKIEAKLGKLYVNSLKEPQSSSNNGANTSSIA